MFEKQVFIKDDCLKVGNKEIAWRRILGLKHLGGPVLEKIFYRLPRIEILLDDGKVIAISNIDRVVNSSSFVSENAKQNINLLMKVINDKAVNLNDDYKHYIQWRLILPILISEVFVLIFSLILGSSFEEMVLAIVTAGILSVPIGWVWDRRKRKKLFLR